MLFHEFVQKLYPVISFGENTVKFTKTILEAIVADEHLDLLDYSDSSYKKFYSGSGSIHKLATKIAAYIDPMLFTEYLNGLNLDDAPVETICKLFSDVLPNIDSFNAREKLGELLSEIITEAAGTNKKSTQMGAKSGKLTNTVVGTKSIMTDTVNSKADNIKVRLPKQLIDMVGRMPKIVPSDEKIQRAIKAAFELTDSKHQDVFANYLNKAVDYYSLKKTLLYAEKPRPFYDIYVCNNLKHHNPKSKASNFFDRRPVISNATVDQLAKESEHIIIEGTGGIGKSMFLTHLFLTSAKEFINTGKCPVFISLKDYIKTIDSIPEFICSAFNSFDSSIKQEHVLKGLSQNRLILLLDGLDEITSSARESFDKILESFVKSYPSIMIIMTSRPVDSFVSFSQFSLFDLKPLAKEQSLALIDKLEFWDPVAKQNFREALDQHLYATHEQFASNPLLLTIMLMTYSTFGEVPEKMHVFYSKAYETMARLHDASKGAYRRPLHTNLTPEEFAQYFSQFCARTYEKETLEFTTASFSSYMELVLKGTSLENTVSPMDFLLDLTNNLCIMYREGDKYYFIHRSFQEYFTAVFFTTVFDDKLDRFGKFVESMRHRSYTDKTFDMLYDMIPEKVERFIFLPFLERKFNSWYNPDTDEMYMNFLGDLYQTIEFDYELTDGSSTNKPYSFLYEFIIRKNNLAFDTSLSALIWPDEVFYLPNKKEWVEAYVAFTSNSGYERWPNPNNIPDSVLDDIMLLTKDELPSEYYNYFGDPDVVGLTIEVDTFNLRQDSDKYPSLLAFITRPDFPIREEFENVKTYYENLKARFNKKTASGGLFDD